MTTFLLGLLAGFLLFVGIDVLMIYRMRDAAAAALIEARKQREAIEADCERQEAR